MNFILRGMVAGFIATVVLSILMIMKTLMGVMPQLDVISMLANILNNWFGLPGTAVVGWIIHFIVGTVMYGIAYALLDGVLPGNSQTIKGIVLGLIGWAIMMIVLMPMVGQGFFAMNIGIMAPIATLVLHIIFGAVLGWTYAKLPSESRKA